MRDAPPLSAPQFASALLLLHAGKVSGRQAKALLKQMAAKGEGRSAAELLEAASGGGGGGGGGGANSGGGGGGGQISDGAELRALCESLLAEHSAEADKARKNPRMIKFFVGGAMKATRGRANPVLLNGLLEALLVGDEAAAAALVAANVAAPPADTGSEKGQKAKKQQKQQKQPKKKKAQSDFHLDFESDECVNNLEIRVGRLSNCRRHPDADSLYIEDT